MTGIQTGQAKKKIAILGGGPAGLAAAWALSRTQALQDRYEVTVFQVGWRAGGKASSGREDDSEQRLLMNGTHFMFGVYFNTFMLGRDAYAALNQAGDRSFGPFENVFQKQSFLVLKHKFRGEWQDWPIQVPINFRKLGSSETNPEPTEILSSLFQGLLDMTTGWKVAREMQPHPPGLIQEGVNEVVNELLVLGIKQALRLLASIDGNTTRQRVMGRLHRLLRRTRRTARRYLASRAQTDLHAYRSWVLIDVLSTFLIGAITDDVLEPGGMAALDDYDYRQWLKHHGASELAIDSPLVVAWYDAIASFHDGDVDQPWVSMAPTMKAMLYAAVGYQGAILYNTQRELGESWAAPVFEALRQRGVQFRFFNRVRELVPEGDIIRSVKIEQQVTLKSGRPDDYEPFVDLQGHKCWPEHPRQDQIEQTISDDVDLEDFYTTWKGEEYEICVGRNFDDIIYALPVETIPFYCAPILKERRSWRDMCEHVRGVDTRTIWLYMNRDLKGLGWDFPSPVVIGFNGPYSVWEDTSYLLKTERWVGEKPPKALNSLLSVQLGPRQVPGPDDPGSYPAEQKALSRANAEEFMMHYAGILWPKATHKNGEIKWDYLYDSADANGPDRMAYQTVRSNYGPMQRYTMAFPGTLKYRMRADESGYRNLYLAGDWTRNGYIVGCVEGAVVSGLKAAKAICGDVEIHETFPNSGL